jgi:V8-like Glu-specific endopeptidase
MRRLGIVAALVLAGCAGGSAGSVEQAIVNGNADTKDTSVVALLADMPGSQGGFLCTAEVISPHVLLTAAHCVYGLDGYRFRMFTGDDLTTATPDQFFDVAEVHADPSYDPSGFGIGDVGIAILAQPTTLATLSYNVTPIPASYRGKTARIAGYGLSSPSQNNSYGQRRDQLIAIYAVTPTLLQVEDAVHTSCEGDSGGPAFITVGNAEVIGGVTSFGFVGCPINQASNYSRVDANKDFIDPYVVAADGPLGTAQVGAPCTTNRDCASDLCVATPDKTMHFCSATCDPSAPATSSGCPATVPCTSVDDIALCMTPTKKSGCDVGGGAPVSSAALLFVALALLVARRVRS